MSTTGRVARDPIADNDLEPGDILIFNIPTYKPGFSRRFIQFMQSARNDSRQYKNAVHAAVVTAVEDDQFGEKKIKIAHYVQGGYQQCYLNDYSSTTGYDHFRAKDAAVRDQITQEAKTPLEHVKTDYSIKKMISAFLKKEKITIPSAVRRGRIFKKLTDDTNTVEICSSFVWRCIKKAGLANDKTKYKGVSSFILPGTLAQRLHHDKDFECRANPKDGNMIFKAFAEIWAMLNKQIEQTSGNKFSIWRQGGHNNAELEVIKQQMTYIYKKCGLETDKNNAAAIENFLREIMPFINEKFGSKVLQTSAYQFLAAEAQKRDIVFSTGKSLRSG